jgi:hypothetical protein
LVEAPGEDEGAQPIDGKSQFSSRREIWQPTFELTLTV